ncbi:DUF2975 domain-containing protein [Mucilaginibacter sp.]|jgi:hypothetical protein|uniref:DUF2975 domain-containing protein n=1 Tax=Mucilaginibacter sp. TaxID=1882438 RepID=UPI0035694874
MKTIRTLQILVYVVFGLFLLQKLLPGVHKGFMEGANWVYDRADGEKTREGKLLPYVFIDGNLLVNKTDNVLKADTDYTFNNVNIISDVCLNNDIIQTPWWFELIKFLLAVVNVWLLFLIARTINKVLVMIYKETMFDESCINLIRKAGAFMLAFSSMDYAFQWLSFAEQWMLIRPPLKVINTSSYNFSIALLAIFIFIIAEAFKQGRKLKEQQDLTI